MKTIYKEPKTTMPEVNEVQEVRKLNNTATLRRIEGTRYDLIVSYDTPIAYVVDVENDTFLNETKVILCNHFYSMTTRKHQAIVRELYTVNFIISENSYAIGEFELDAFRTRADIDSVDVRGGANGGNNSNYLYSNWESSLIHKA